MTTALEGCEWSAAHPGRTLPLGESRYPLYRRLGGPQARFGRAENFTPTGIRSPDHPARSQSLYRLSYPAHRFESYWLEFPLFEHGCNQSVSFSIYQISASFALYRDVIAIGSVSEISVIWVYWFGWCSYGVNALEKFAFPWMESFPSYKIYEPAKQELILRMGHKSELESFENVPPPLPEWPILSSISG